MPSAASLEQLKERLCRREHMNHSECEKALLPTLEHASLVHSHIHHPISAAVEAPDVAAAAAADGHDHTHEQTRNAVIYISLVVVVYVVVILWLVSSNFRSAAASAAASAQAASTGSFYRRILDAVAGTFTGSHEDQEDYYETEALLVVQDEKGKNRPRCTTYFEEECEGEPV